VKDLRTETIELDDRFGAEYRGKYVFQEISWAKRSRIIQKHTKYHPITGQVVSSDYVSIQAEQIWASLKDQPATKPISLEKLLGEENGIPIELGELFSKVANRLCSVTTEETRFLSEPSDEGGHIQASQSIDAVVSSSACLVNSDEKQRRTSKPSS